MNLRSHTSRADRASTGRRSRPASICPGCSHCGRYLCAHPDAVYAGIVAALAQETRP